LRETAAAHPDVLDYPKPTALFLGFGDSALNFEVRFWAPRPEIVPELKSDVALSIAAALSEAGIKVPIPQRDLHIKSIDQATGEAVAFPANERKGRGSNSTDPTNADAIDNVNDRERTT
jgi:small-conductance mechanosensitive channel